MSEAAPEPIEEVTPEEPDVTESAEQPTFADAQPDTGAQQEEEKDWKAEAEKWKALSRRHESTAKANSEAAKRWNEFEESQKSEQQKLMERLELVERERDEERRARARLVAAATYDLPASLLERIGGSSEEEINESAKALAEEIEAVVAERLAAAPPPPAPEPPAPAPSVPASTRPVESLRPGAMPANAGPTDGNDWLRQFVGRT